MDAKELLQASFDSSLQQVNAVYAGLPDAHWDTKLVPTAMSPRETLLHLSDCCVALQKVATGEEHEWGSVKATDNSAAGLMAQFQTERAKALEAASTFTEMDKLKEGMGYISLHEAYHVGQLAQLRIHTEPDWNAYSIYGM